MVSTKARVRSVRARNAAKAAKSKALTGVLVKQDIHPRDVAYRGALTALRDVRIRYHHVNQLSYIWNEITEALYRFGDERRAKEASKRTE